MYRSKFTSRIISQVGGFPSVIDSAMRRSTVASMSFKFTHELAGEFAAGDDARGWHCKPLDREKIPAGDANSRPAVAGKDAPVAGAWDLIVEFVPGGMRFGEGYQISHAQRAIHHASGSAHLDHTDDAGRDLHRKQFTHQILSRVSRAELGAGRQVRRKRIVGV